jgi:hypothetical protein
MTFRRIVLGFATTGSEPAVQAATELARAMQLSLLGLFVEEVDLLHLAALPFAAEVSFPSALTRRLDPAAMERSLRARSRHARESLSRRLEGLSLRWDFAVVRGSALSALLAVAAEDDLVVAAIGGGSLVERERRYEVALREVLDSRHALLLVDRRGPRAPVVAVMAPKVSLAAVGAELGALSRHYGGSLSVLAIRNEATTREGEDASAVAMLADRGVSVRVQQVAEVDAASMLDSIAAERPGLLALCGSDAFADAMRPRLARLACSLLLLPGPLR